MKKIAALATVSVLVLAGCSSQPTTTGPGSPATAAQGGQTSGASSADVLASLGLSGLTGQQIVEKIDQDPAARPLSMKASVRPDQVVVGNGQAEAAVPLTGENSFYYSIAPYQTRTHDCYHHSLATCNGELKNKPVHLTITDSAGKVLVDKDATTYANGFVGVWLPKDIHGTATVTVGGLSGSVPFATGAQDKTCETTLKLS